MGKIVMKNGVEVIQMKLYATIVLLENATGIITGAMINPAGVIVLVQLALLLAVAGILTGVIAVKQLNLTVMRLLTKMTAQMQQILLHACGIHGLAHV